MPATKPVKTVRAVAKREKQTRLPGMADPKLLDLHKAAEEYVEVRDHRMQLTEEEVELNANVLQLMKKYDKQKYVCDDVEIRVVHTDEKVKVKKLKKAKDAEEE